MRTIKNELKQVEREIRRNNRRVEKLSEKFRAEKNKTKAMHMLIKIKALVERIDDLYLMRHEMLELAAYSA